MKKFISILMALALMVGCCTAFAETVSPYEATAYTLYRFFGDQIYDFTVTGFAEDQEEALAALTPDDFTLTNNYKAMNGKMMDDGGVTDVSYADGTLYIAVDSFRKDVGEGFILQCTVEGLEDLVLTRDTVTYATKEITDEFLESCGYIAFDGTYTATDLGRNVIMIEDSFSHNPSDIYVVLGSEKAMVIDSGNFYEDESVDLRAFVEQFTGEREIVYGQTHQHGDHYGEIDAFADCPIYWSSLETESDAYSEDYILTSEGDVIDLGDRQIEVFQLSGHTPGALIFIDKGNECVFTGDAIGSTAVGLSGRASLVETMVEFSRLYGVIMDMQDPMIKVGHEWGNLAEGYGQGVDVTIDGNYLLDMVEVCAGVLRGTVVGHDYTEEGWGESTGRLYATVGNASIMYSSEEFE